MSSHASFLQLTVPNEFDGQGATPSVQHVGSIFRATPSAAADGQTRSFQIDAFGRLVVIGASADNAARAGNPIAVGGVYNAALPTYDDGDQATVQHDASGRVIVNDDQLLTAFNAEDFAQEATLDALLTAFNAEDFATQTTLAALLAAFNAEDFATETTLAAILADTANIDTNIAAILADTANMDTNIAAILADTANMDTNIASILADTNAILADTANIDANIAAILADTAAIDTNIAAILADTANMDTNITAILADTAAIDTNVAAIASKLGTGAVLNAIYTNYASSNLPGNASNPLELVASLASDVRKIQVFDTGGVPCELMTGAATAETRLMVIGPGADTELDVNIASGTRVSIRRLDSASALTGGDSAINFLS